MAFRYIASSGLPTPALTANKMEAFCCTPQRETLERRLSTRKLPLRAVEVVDLALEGEPLKRDTVKLQAFTNKVKETLGVRRVPLRLDDASLEKTSD